MNTCKTIGRGQLAELYNPHLSPSAARKQLAAWMARHPTLLADLTKTGYDSKQRSFTPRQVEIIFEALGEP